MRVEGLEPGQTVVITQQVGTEQVEVFRQTVQPEDQGGLDVALADGETYSCRVLNTSSFWSPWSSFETSQA